MAPVRRGGHATTVDRRPAHLDRGRGRARHALARVDRARRQRSSASLLLEVSTAGRPTRLEMTTRGRPADAAPGAGRVGDPRQRGHGRTGCVTWRSPGVRSTSCWSSARRRRRRSRSDGSARRVVVGRDGDAGRAADRRRARAPTDALDRRADRRGTPGTCATRRAARSGGSPSTTTGGRIARRGGRRGRSRPDVWEAVWTTSSRTSAFAMKLVDKSPCRRDAAHRIVGPARRGTNI